MSKNSETGKEKKRPQKQTHGYGQFMTKVVLQISSKRAVL
jgi:hypothetical protein